MSRNDRVNLIKAIEKKRRSKVITYVTGDRVGIQCFIAGDVIPVIERHLRRLCTPRTKKLDLFLYSRGGDANMPWTLVSMIRECLGDRSLGVLIPFRAHSAATVIALGADEIVMGQMGELGPIDATIPDGPHNPRDPQTNERLPISVEDARGFFTLLETIGLNEPTHKLAAFDQLSKNVHPLALGSVSRILDQTKKVAELLLETRNSPLSTAENEAIVNHLTSGITSHVHTIRRTEAIKLGLNYVASTETEDIEDELWALYEQYAKVLELESPFNPSDSLLHDTDLEEKWYKGLRIGFVESTWRTDVATVDYMVRRLRDVPPQVNFSLSNVQFPVPELPQDINAQSLQQMINEILSPVVQAELKAAADRAIRELVKAMPQKGFQNVRTNFRWSRDQASQSSD